MKFTTLKLSFAILMLTVTIIASGCATGPGLFGGDGFSSAGSCGST